MRTWAVGITWWLCACGGSVHTLESSDPPPGEKKVTKSEPEDTIEGEEEKVPVEPSPVPRGREDYAIRIGIGFTPGELTVLQRAADSWRDATGLPIHFRDGYGPMGNFHIAEQIPVCGQRWVYDGFLGCYHADADIVVLNRHGIALEQRRAADLLYIVLLHEIGHWLGLGHAEEGEDSIMLQDYAKLVEREDEFTALSERDIHEVCRKNGCDIGPAIAPAGAR